jgi:hypothetical protein
MSIATLIRRLGELGASHEMIALAVEEIEASQLSLEARRSADRERKRLQREREKSADVTGQVTPCHSDVTERVSLDKEKAPRPPKEINPIPCVKGGRARLDYHRLPEGWAPTRAFPAALLAKLDIWPPGSVDDEIACFKRWAANAPDQNGKGRKLDWDKALVNWLTRKHDDTYGKIARIDDHRRKQPSGWQSAYAANGGSGGVG